MTKDYGILPKVFDGIFWAIFGIAVFFLFNLYIVFAIVFFLLSFLLELFTRMKFVEYEYEYFDKEITISKIMNKKKRKKITAFNIENITKVSKPESFNKNNITLVYLKNVKSNNKEFILTIRLNNGEKNYGLSIDDKLFNILKSEKPTLFNF